MNNVSVLTVHNLPAIATNLDDRKKNVVGQITFQFLFSGTTQLHTQLQLNRLIIINYLSENQLCYWIFSLVVLSTQ